MNLSKLLIPLRGIIGEAELLLVDVTPVFQYDDTGKRTENLIGYRYWVFEKSHYEKFPVKIPDLLPAFSKEDLANAKSEILVDFRNCYGKIYRTQNGGIDISFTADSIERVK